MVVGADVWEDGLWRHSWGVRHGEGTLHVGWGEGGGIECFDFDEYVGWSTKYMVIVEEVAAISEEHVKGVVCLWLLSDNKASIFFRLVMWYYVVVN